MFFDRCYFCVSMLAALLESIVFHVLSSPRNAGTIFLPFYHRRSARKQYFCHFIVTAQRGNNIFAVLSSPCSAGIIFLHFIVCSITASIKIFVFTFAERRCVFGMVGAVPVCPPERPRSGVSIPKIHTLCAGNGRWMRPCGATRAGTQAPPLPNSIMPFCTIPLNDIIHPRAIRP